MQEFNFRYPYARLDGDNKLVKEICQAGNDVHRMLCKLDLTSVGISEYNQRYLSEKFSKPVYEYSLVTYMLSYLLSNTRVPRENLTFLDYGAGSGIICLVAKALGIGTVIFSDIYDVSCTDAKTLGRLINLEADHYIAGDIEDVRKHMQSHRLYCDLMASHDCLEHIYNIEAFLNSVPSLPTKGMTIWLSSAANPLRPKSRRTLSKLAVDRENEDQPQIWGHKERDALSSFYSIRRRMIQQAAPQLDDSGIDTLARKTRGMREDDILPAVQKYQSTGEFPPDPEHPTNTCDPYTGNWAERLMDPFQLIKIATPKGLTLKVKTGFWAVQPNEHPKNFAKAVTNAFMSYIGDHALRFAPFYVLHGVYPANAQNVKGENKS